MSKAKFDAAKELIKEKKYNEARAILATIDHTTAREWEAKLDKLSPGKAVSEPKVKREKISLPNRTRGIRIWRNIWGVLVLLSMAWLCYGLFVSSTAYADVTEGVTSEAAKGGAALGASLGLGVFLCTGLPFLLIFLYAYARAGATIRSERQHREMLDAMSQRG